MSTVAADSHARSPAVWPCCLILTITVLATFGQVVWFELLDWDDPVNITRNPLLKSPSLATMFEFWKAPYAGLYVPVTYSLWSIEAKLALVLSAVGIAQPLDPRVFHAGNLFLHLCSTLLLFAILRRLVRDNLAALAGALLFGLHPLAVESVAWVTETKGLLATLFSLLAICLFLKFIDRTSDRAGEIPSRWKSSAIYALATAAFCLALLSKPSAVTIPAICAVLVIAFLKVSWQRALLALLPWLLLCIGPMIITKQQQPDEMLSTVPSVPGRILVAADAVTFYLSRLVWPVRLGPDYGRSPQVVLAGDGGYWSIGILVGLVTVSLAVRRLRFTLLSLAIFVLALAPVLGLVPFAYQRFSTVADRYTYFAIVAAALGLAVIVSHWHKPAPRWFMLVMIGCLALGSFTQAAHWRTNETLYRQALRANPNSMLAHNGLGNLLAGQGEWQAALDEYRAAAAADPTSASAQYNLGRALAALGRRQASIAAFREALKLRPGYEKAHFELAVVLAANGQVPAARQHLEIVIQINPSRADAWSNLGRIAEALRDWNRAENCYRQAIKYSAERAEVHERLAAVLEAQGDRVGARQEIETAIGLDPRRASAIQAKEKLSDAPPIESASPASPPR